MSYLLEDKKAATNAILSVLHAHRVSLGVEDEGVLASRLHLPLSIYNHQFWLSQVRLVLKNGHWDTYHQRG